MEEVRLADYMFSINVWDSLWRKGAGAMSKKFGFKILCLLLSGCLLFGCGGKEVKSSENSSQGNLGLGDQSGDTQGSVDPGQDGRTEDGLSGARQGADITLGGQESGLELFYDTEVNVTFTEPGGNKFNMELGFRTQNDNVTYLFAGTLTEESRDYVVSEFVACFHAIEEQLDVSDGEYTVYVCDKSYLPRVEGSILYIGYDNIETVRFAAAIAQLVCGTSVNYGVLYGLGASIADQRGYSLEDSVSIETALTLYDEAPQYLDLNYACFLDNYADRATQQKVRAICIAFYQYLYEHNRTDLLTSYSDAKRHKYFNEFLLANGKGTYDNTDLDGIAFYGGGQAVRLSWETVNAIYHLYDDYTDLYPGGSFGAAPLNDGYEDLIRHITNFEIQIKHAQEELGEYNDSSERVMINFISYKDMQEHFDAIGYYRLEEHTIYAGSVSCVMHEYIHSLTSNKRSKMLAMMFEGLAYYFSCYPTTESLGYWLLLDQDYIDGIYDDNMPQEYIEFIKTLTTMIGHKPDLFTYEDFVAYHDTSALYFYNCKLESFTNNANLSISFFNYLINCFGKDNVCEAAFNNSPSEVLGKSWDMLISEWKTYLYDKYPLFLP